MSINKSNFQSTADAANIQESDNHAFGEWWAWTQVISEAIRRASTRLALGIMASGFAVASSLLFQSEQGVVYGRMMLWTSLGLALWFALSAAASGLRGR